MRTNICLAILALFVLAPFNGAFSQYTLSVESSAAVGTGGTVYRFYVNANDDTDKISAVFGNNESNLVISTPDNIFNSPFNSSWNASGINPAFLPLFPDLADDSYATINLEGPASTSGLAGAADPSIVEDSSLSPTVSGYFTAGGTELNVSTLVGASWYVLNTATNALPANGRWLIAQITTTGAISGQMNYQVFPLGVGDDQEQYSTAFDGVGTFTGTCTLGCDGGTTDVPGCTDSSACNYDSSATVDDGSCATNDECGVCGGSGIPDGDCDCFGNQVDALGECGGECAEDADGDSICDDVDDCVGQYDECGVCNGDGIAEGACDCDGNQLDACGVCGGSGVDADDDGICDDVDDCVGGIDGCGVCNGDGTTCTGCMDPAASNYSADNIFEDNGQCLYATTFNVDMSCATNAGAMLNGSSSFYEVFVTGPFAGWAANDGWNQLTDDDGDGVYSVTLDFAAGTIEYKYAIDGFGDQEQLVDDMQNGGDCAPVTDYAGYANRQVAAGSTTSDTYGSCSSCADQVAPVNITFQVDMSQYAEAYAYGGVFVNGSFNGWCGGCNPMDDTDGDGVWSVTLPLMPGTVEYKFTLDGWNYQEEFAGGESCTSTIGGYTNRSLTFDAETVLEAVCWESCAACPTASDVFGCMDETANNYNADATADPNNACLYDVTLSVDVSQTDFTSVSLAGTFNGWNNASNYMDDADGDGVYTITVSMSAGDQEYKFLGNGDWAVAEAFDGSESCTTPPAEFVNRVITVAGPTVADTVCYNSCEACVDPILGCTDADACNYDLEANADDGSCIFAPDYYECDGETCLNDTDGDGVCDELEVEGCVVPTACNYVASGVTDLVPCVYPEPGYNCDGTCIGDADGDGVCDANEVVGCQDSTACNYDAAATDEGTCDFTSCLGCTDEAACNYDDAATQDDGSCDFCSCANEAAGGVNGYNLLVEEYAVDGIPGLTTYRLYVTTPNADDFVSAIAGDHINQSYLRTSTEFYQNPLGGLTAGNINPLFFAAFPEIQYDSWLTIGIDQAPVPGDGTADVTIASAAGETWIEDFEAGYNLELNSFFGGSWFTTNLTTNGVAGDDLKVLVAQLTTDGTLTGSLYVQVFPLGVGADAEYLTLSFGNIACGCTDDTACNYSGGAIYDDGSCFYVGVYDCDANCVNDTDGDGVCDELEIVGCSDAEACNYNADATDEGACEYVEPTLLPSEGGCTLFFSGYAEGSSNHKFMEIYNPTDADIDLAGYAFPNVSNAPDNGAGNYDFWNAFPEGAVIAAGDVYVIAHGSADPSILAEADHTFTYLSNGDDGFMLVMGTETDYIMIDAIGDWNGDPGSGWEVAGVANGTQNHSLIRKSDVTSGNGGDWTASAGTNADDSEWIVLDQDDWTGVGSHEFTGDCGAGEYAVIYDCDGVCLNDTDSDGVCDEIEVEGCTDSGACNYDMLATDEDGSCEYLTCAGCTDSEGCNYDDTATIEDGSCTYPDPFLDCAGNCLNDLNINGICDELEVLGCTYAAACNYDADANVDDGECDFSCLLTGCTDSAADNYDAAATVDDGNCFYVGCVDPNGLNYDSGANLPGACEYCEGDFNYDGEVDVNDLLDFFQLWGNTCD